MYSTRIIDSADPDQFVACGRPTADLTVTERGRFRARVVRIDVDRVWGQRVRESLACLKQVEISRGSVLFMIEPGPSMFMGGVEIGMDQVAVVPPGDCYNWRSSGATHWGTVSLVKGELCRRLNGAAADLRAKQVGGVSVFAPTPMALARLRSVHDRMGRLAETAPELLTNTDLSHDLEDDLLSATLELRDTHASGSDTVCSGQRQIIVNRFRAVIEAQADQPFKMPEISRKIGVCGRTLRVACQEQLGVSPLQYVMLRRLRAARRALQKADPDITRVTDIATEYGFWELGRFAVRYRHVFGETPSATLKSPTPSQAEYA
jgi:AraC-like DNA-binding protein